MMKSYSNDYAKKLGRTYFPEVAHVGYKYSENAKQVFFSCPARAFIFYWFAKTGKLIKFLFSKKTTNIAKHEQYREIMIEFSGIAREKLT